MARPEWLARLSKSFKAHRQGRPGWNVEVMRDRLRVVSAELPPRPDEPADAPAKRRAVTLKTAPGPANGTEALAEASAIFDSVMAGTWRWPDPDGLDTDDAGRLSPKSLQALIDRLEKKVVNERVVPRTWKRTYLQYFKQLLAVAGSRAWQSDTDLLTETLRHWKPNSRSRQQAHDRFRSLYKEAGWGWPESVLEMRGNGKAAAPVEGVKGFTAAESLELRERIKRSKLGPESAVAWDLMAAFGIRPAELKGITLKKHGASLVAVVKREKTTLRGKEAYREVPAAPPEGWPADCFDLAARLEKHGLPPRWMEMPDPSDPMGQQLKRLHKRAAVSIEIDPTLTPYGHRHAFALRLATLGCNYRESADLMGHSPATHLLIYGQVLDTPKLIDKVLAAQA